MNKINGYKFLMASCDDGFDGSNYFDCFDCIIFVETGHALSLRQKSQRPKNREHRKYRNHQNRNRQFHSLKHHCWLRFHYIIDRLINYYFSCVI